MMRVALLVALAIIGFPVVFVFAWLRYCWAVLTSHERAWRLAVSLDQFANAVTNGHEDETISSRANRARLAGRRWGCILCRFLDVLDKDHCAKSAGT